ncbi:TIR domain-containing protein [bacterium]|nr:TIR domain-containing protein [bacterium]
MDEKILTPFEAYKGDEEFIFISYSHSEIDRDLVFRDIKQLHDIGYNIWYDEGISGGDRWTLAITESLKKSSKIILFISPRSVLSDNIISEINIAKNIGKPILPIMIEQTEITGTEVEYLIGMRNILNRQSMTEEKYFKKVRGFLDSKNPVSKPKVTATPVTQPEKTFPVIPGNTELFTPVRILTAISITLLVIVSIFATLYFSQSKMQNNPTNYVKDTKEVINKTVTKKKSFEKKLKAEIDNFLPNTGFVNIIVNPPQTKIFIQHKKKLTYIGTGSTLRYELFPKKYQVICKAEGYKTIKEPLYIFAEKERTISFKLKKIITPDKVKSEEIVPEIKIDTLTKQLEITPVVRKLIARGKNKLSNDTLIFILMDGLVTSYSVIPYGLQIMKIPPDSVCDIAGLYEGDLILTFNEIIASKTGVIHQLLAYPKSRIKVKILRDGKEINKTILINNSLIVKMLLKK